MLTRGVIRPRFAPARHGVDLPPQRFGGKLTIANIYGGWWASARDGFFTVRWGRFYAYLHQFDAESQSTLVAACAAGEEYRDRPHTGDTQRRGHV
ncbi:MAG: hypothetical protein ACJ8LG_22830 [Massilia sp.]